MIFGGAREEEEVGHASCLAGLGHAAPTPAQQMMRFNALSAFWYTRLLRCLSRFSSGRSCLHVLWFLHKCHAQLSLHERRREPALLPESSVYSVMSNRAEGPRNCTSCSCYHGCSGISPSWSVMRERRSSIAKVQDAGSGIDEVPHASDGHSEGYSSACRAQDVIRRHNMRQGFQPELAAQPDGPILTVLMAARAGGKRHTSAACKTHQNGRKAERWPKASATQEERDPSNPPDMGVSCVGGFQGLCQGPSEGGGDATDALPPPRFLAYQAPGAR